MDDTFEIVTQIRETINRLTQLMLKAKTLAMPELTEKEIEHLRQADEIIESLIDRV